MLCDLAVLVCTVCGHTPSQDRCAEFCEQLLKGVLFGGDEEDRTPDLRIANATLSQLSYVPSANDYIEAENEGQAAAEGVRAANKTLLASLRSLAVLLVLSAAARLARSAALSFVSRS